jgi:predicted alpha/beta-fold hydrolase
VRLEREILETPDGDELVLDHFPTTDNRPPTTHFILLHGLEGSSYSAYVQGILSIIARRGFSATAMNFRSCARDTRNVFRMLINRRPRFYHSGETGDFDFVARTLHSRMPSTPVVAFGASLGGNALLKWLGEHPEQSMITAAATISVPYDLSAGARYLQRGAGPLYVSRFLRTMKKKSQSVVARFPEVRLNLAQAMRARTFHEFDDASTAPLNGFKDAEDYYAQSSSLGYLGSIRTPALCISSEDDPFLPPEVLERARAVASPAVEFVITKCGGHVGFIGGRAPWRCVYWAEELVVDWLARWPAATIER